MESDNDNVHMGGEKGNAPKSAQHPISHICAHDKGLGCKTKGRK